ncbi:hypothetical protein IJM86_03230 [bacterium]|nr:hypothetical protein [bacterium]
MLKKDHCPNGDFSDSYYDRTCEKTKKEAKPEQTHGTSERTKEEMDVFQRALKNELTSKTTLESFRGNEGLKRSEMAKVISIFTMQFMDKKKSPNNECQNFNDIKEITSDLHDYIILACELGIMGRTADGQ